jgi:hypothetical protein
MKSFSDSGWFLYGCNGSLWGILLPSLGRNHLDSNTTENFLRDWGRRRPQMKSKNRQMARPYLLPSYAGYQKGRELDLSSDGSCRVHAVPPGRPQMRSKIREMARPHLLPSYAGYRTGRGWICSVMEAVQCMPYRLT